MSIFNLRTAMVVLFAIVISPQLFAQAAPADAFVGTIGGANPRAALNVTVSSIIDLTAAADCVMTFEYWDPTANNGAGAFVPSGQSSKVTINAGCQGTVWNQNNTFLAGTSGKQVRAKLEIKRNNAAVYTNYTNTIRCP
jgi:hypothetical protein